MTPRVAFFTDSFHEVNGVALTSRAFDQYASERGLPFLSVHRGPVTRQFAHGNTTTLELANSRAALKLDHGLYFDLLFARHLGRVCRAVSDFKADLVHVTGPGHLGLLGLMASRICGVPLAASWHTNVHEYAARRFRVGWAEKLTLSLCAWFYKHAKAIYAPNPELVRLLQERTGRPVYEMLRGIDLDLFSPEHRDRTDGQLTIGFVGRLSPEKNVQLLPEIERALVAAGVSNYRFVIVGGGSRRAWLEAHLKKADFTGVLRGIELARAYANMDVFVFPSRTDTFGNVVLEALASGVPAVVSSGGGPKFIIEPRRSGLVADTPEEFASAILRVQEMKKVARERAGQFSWPRVFDGIYKSYKYVVNEKGAARSATPLRVDVTRS